MSRQAPIGDVHSTLDDFFGGTMHKDLKAFLPHPKSIGQSEYHAIYEALSGIEEVLNNRKSS